MSKTVLCIGATLVDELYFCEAPAVAASSNPAKKTTCIGGVMSNIVQHLALLEVKVSLLTAIGTDADGAFIAGCLDKMGIDWKESVCVPDSTGKYVSILNPNGSLYVAVCQDISAEYLTVSFLESKSDYLRSFDLILIDTNIDPIAIQWLIHFAKTYNKTLIIEPVSVPKAAKLAKLNLESVYMITPNEEELYAMTTVTGTDNQTHLNALHQRGVTNVWLRKGNQGSVMHQENKSTHLLAPPITVVDSTGAGDAALAGWVFGHLQEQDQRTCLQLGHSLAFNILQMKGAVDDSLTIEKLFTLKHIYYHDEP
jgi:pseudouridine kinase